MTIADPGLRGGPAISPKMATDSCSPTVIEPTPGVDNAI